MYSIVSMLSRNCLITFACSIKMYGALEQRRMSNLRNGNVPCRYFLNFHVGFEIAKCRLSNLMKGPCHVTNIISHDGSMSHVDFKKWPCRPVKFKGQGPHV